jgi:hypothetical protein
MRLKKLPAFLKAAFFNPFVVSIHAIDILSFSKKYNEVQTVLASAKQG